MKEIPRQGRQFVTYFNYLTLILMTCNMNILKLFVFKMNIIYFCKHKTNTHGGGVNRFRIRIIFHTFKTELNVGYFQTLNFLFFFPHIFLNCDVFHHLIPLCVFDGQALSNGHLDHSITCKWVPCKEWLTVI